MCTADNIHEVFILQPGAQGKVDADKSCEGTDPFEVEQILAEADRKRCDVCKRRED